MDLTRELPEANEARWQVPCYECGTYYPLFRMYNQGGPGYTCPACHNTNTNTQRKRYEYKIPRAR